MRRPADEIYNAKPQKRGREHLVNNAGCGWRRSAIGISRTMLPQNWKFCDRILRKHWRFSDEVRHLYQQHLFGNRKGDRGWSRLLSRKARSEERRVGKELR